MSNQPYEPERPYDPYQGRQQPRPGEPEQQYRQPGQRYDQPAPPYEEPRPPQQQWPTGQQPGYAGEEPQSFTQTWQTQTWETQNLPPVAAAEETAYLPSQAGGPGQPYPGGQPYQEAPAPQQPSYGDPQPYHPNAEPPPYGSAAQQPYGSGPQQPYGNAPQQQPYGNNPQQPYGDAEPQSYGPAQSYGGDPQPYGGPEPSYGDPQSYGVPQTYGTPQPQPQPQSHAAGGPAQAAAASASVPASVPAPGAEGGAGTPGPGFGPATLTGNPRVTDAQRARAEGRSPIIEPGMQPAALTAVLALLLCGGAALGQYALLLPLVVLQAVTAAGWFRLNGMWPARQGIALAFLGALVADVAVLAAGRDNAPAAILGSLGVWVLLSVTLQLRSHASPDERLHGLMATIVSAALAILAAGHLAAAPEAVETGAFAVAVALVVRALPLPTLASVVVALLASAGAGVLSGGLSGFGSGGAAVGLGAGACALIGHRVASYDYPSRFVHMTAGVALPLAAAAPAVYILGRAFG